MPDFTIEIVDDEACPVCGAFWGHEDEALNFPNRTKVHDEDGWWWRCYNPKCPVDYYNPDNGEWQRVPTPEEEKKIAAETKKYIDSIDFSKVKVTEYTTE